MIYIAGPYTADDAEGVELNVARAIQAGDRLEDSGLAYAVIPHLSHYRHINRPRGYEHWMEADAALLGRCDALLRLHGESRGADREVGHAKAWNIPVFRDESELLAWAEGFA